MSLSGGRLSGDLSDGYFNFIQIDPNAGYFGRNTITDGGIQVFDISGATAELQTNNLPHMFLSTGSADLTITPLSVEGNDIAKESWQEWLEINNVNPDVDLDNYATKDDLALKADKSTALTSSDAKSLNYLYVAGNTSDAKDPDDGITKSLRNINTHPSDYMSKKSGAAGGNFKISGFKYKNAINLNDNGSSNVATVLGLAPWKDTINETTPAPAHEIAFTDDGMFRRQGGNIPYKNSTEVYLDNEFGEWKRIIDSDNIKEYLNNADKPEINPIFADNDWDVISWVCRNDDPSKYWKVGDMKEVNVYTVEASSKDVVVCNDFFK